jgi:hypothetical protein
MQQRFDVTLIFCNGGSYGARFFAESKIAAKAQAIRWARECGFVGAIKKAEVIEITIEVSEVINVSKTINVSQAGA